MPGDSLLPSDWAFPQLAEIARDKPNSFVIGPFGSNLVTEDYQAAGVPVVFVRDVKPGVFRWKSNVYVTPEKAAELRPHSVIPGDVVITKMGLPAGIAARYPDTMPPGIVTADIIRLRTREATASSIFIAHALNAPIVAEQVRQLTGGQTRPKLTLRDYKTVRVPLPPLPEQQKIASILSAVDDTIEKTQAVIDQAKVVKRELLAELMTKGISGRPKDFQQTELRQLPSTWNVVLLDSVAKRGSGHTPDKKHPEYWDGSIKWVSLKDSARLDRLYISDTSAKITPLGIENSSAVEHPAGTVVVSRDAGVGKSAITTDVMAVSQHFMAWQCGPRLDNHFLYYWLQRLKPKLEQIATGNTIKTIGLPYFKQLKIPLPPIEEQRAIADSLKSIDLRIFAEEQALDGLHLVKNGLLACLLSGTVRVEHSKQGAT